MNGVSRITGGLVARGGSQSEVFSAVAEEMARCLNVENADVFRYEDDGATIVAVAAFAERGYTMPFWRIRRWPKDSAHCSPMCRNVTPGQPCHR
jgi:hypothetical protein